MEWKKEVIVALIISVIIVVIGSFIQFSMSGFVSDEENKDIVYLTDETNLESYLESQPIIQAIPDNSIIGLKTYIVENREWKYNRKFILTGKDVSEIEPINYDAIVYLPSSYINDLKSQSLCDVLKKANSKGDLFIDTNQPATTLAWKLKSMWKYRRCLE